jgi:hypothetical protein
MSTHKRLKMDPYLSSYIKYVKKGFNVRTATLKLLEEITGKTLQNIGLGNEFLNRLLIA